MDREKLLAFLNTDPKKPIDQFTMKLISGFYFAFSVFVFGGGAFLQLISFTWLNCCVLFFCVLSNAIAFFSIRFCKKTSDEWFYHFSVVICSVLILLYGWLVFSNGEFVEFGYSKFDWMHIAVLLSALALGIYILLKFYQAYRITMNNTIEKAQLLLQSKKNNPILIPGVMVCSPVALAGLFRDTYTSMDLGIGFGLWSLMCVWLALALFILPKIIVILKYKVYLWCNTEDDSIS